MPSVTVSRMIAASPERVWDVLTDFENLPNVVDAISSVTRVGDGEGFAVGTRWRETRKIMGRQATEEMFVTAIEPGRGFTVDAENHGAHYTASHLLEPVGNGTLVTLTFGAVPVSRFGRIMAAVTGPLFRSSTRKALEGDLAAIAAAAEGSEHPDQPAG